MFAEELSDHLQDFKEDAMSTEADMYSQFGEPEQVANAALVAYQQHSFLGRHPTAAFLIFRSFADCVAGCPGHACDYWFLGLA